jgi:ubiquinone/menaquinone biosynthesis C-methylase UbiE
MSADLQRATYADADEIGSDPWHILNRDNRNHRKKLNCILDVTHADPGDRVLEVGCGHGLHAPPLADRFDYYGIDLSPRLVEETQRRAPAGIVRQMDAAALAFNSDLFDAVVGTAILHHLADQREALREWCRVVQPGGSITLMEPNYLFPKDFVSAHVQPEEQHKTNMAPWRLRQMCDALGVDFELTPHLYTPPWPARFHDWFDRIDDFCRDVPGARWCSQMLRLHIRVE